jgi:transcriptional regulator with XRE-family HTH domain
MAADRSKSGQQTDLPPGQFLRKVRQRLHMGFRDVQEASAILAAEQKNDEFYISAARLFQIENEPSAPSAYKLLSLSAIYGLDFLDLLGRYGVNPDRLHHYRSILSPATTRLLSSRVYRLDTTVKFPVRMDPRFRWETTQLINRAVAVWGEIPAAFLVGFNPREHMWGYVGLEDTTMFPLLRPGALVMVDGHRRRIIQKEWENESERPIYFVELREGYRCAWCQIGEGRLTLIPSPLSSVPAQTFSYPNDAEVVGQVVGVWMRIAPPGEEIPER